MQRALFATTLVLIAGLSGCIGASDDGSGDGVGRTSVPGGPMDGGIDGPPETGPAADVVFAALDAPHHEVEWFNGTFDVTQHSYPKGLVTSETAGEYDPDKRVHDITHLVPRGVPVRLVAEANADLGEGDIDIWFNAPSEEIWSSDFDTPYGGYSHVEYTIVRTSSEPIELVIRYDEIDDSQEFDYTLVAQAHADPSILPPGVPVTVPSGPGSIISFQAVDRSLDTRVLGWDGADAYLGDLALEDGRGEITFDHNVTAGEFVVMVADGGSPVRATVATAARDSGPVDAGLVRQDIVAGQPHGPSDGASYTWSYDVARVPLQVGYFVAGPEVSQDFSGSLASSRGTLFEVGIEDGPWLGVGLSFTTPMGHANLAPGTYEGHVEFGAGIGPENIQVTDYVVYYAR